MPLPMFDQAVNVLDATSLLSSFGAIGIAVVMFAETGLLIGFFLPGDSLLFTAGLLSVSGASDVVHLSLWQVLIASLAGALLGAQAGYLIGRRGGTALLARSRNRKLHQGAERAAELLERYGHAKAVVLGRFIPVVRTVLNPLAGALNVPARTSRSGRSSAARCGRSAWCSADTRSARRSRTWTPTCCRSWR